MSHQTGMAIGIVATFFGVLFADFFLIMAGAVVIAMETNKDE